MLHPIDRIADVSRQWKLVQHAMVHLQKTDYDCLIHFLATYTSVRHEVKLWAKIGLCYEQLNNAEHLSPTASP